MCRALWIGTAGDLVVVMSDETDTVTFAAIPAGTLLPIQAKAVRNTSTAGSIVALY